MAKPDLTPKPDGTIDKMSESVTFFCYPKDKKVWQRAFNRRELSYTIRRLLNEEVMRLDALKGPRV